MISVCACTEPHVSPPRFHIYIYKISVECSRHHSTSLQEMQYTQIHQTLLFYTSTECWRGGRLPGCRKLQCREGACRELQGWEGKDAEGDVETISPSLARSLARFLLPASFQASVPQQLSEEKTNKSEKRQAGEGDVPPQESTCLVDLFLGTRCALTIP